jgi:tetratricopeptide (TPR) repeat protein
MSPEDWLEVKELFAELAERNSAERQARLGGLREPVRAELEWLLANHDAARTTVGILDRPAVNSPNFLQWLGEAKVFEPGQVLLDRFEVIRMIGRGGMGEVYEALDRQHPEIVAIKTIRLELLSNAGVRERFRLEVQRSRQVSHPNVCRVHELFSGPGGSEWEIPFFTMELLQGETLYERVQRCGPLTGWEALDVASQICAGLEAAHRCGVVHRDLKSSNIVLLEAAGAAVTAKITDFGLARELPSDGDSVVSSALGGASGTLAYMAPELLEGRRGDRTSDVYSLGVVLYRMVTGRYPFEAEADLVSAAMRIRHPAPSPRTHAPRLSRSWERAILACLAGDAKMRPRTAAHVSALLRDRPAALWSQRVRAASGRLRRREVLVGGGVAATTAAVALSWGRWHAPPFAGREVAVLVEDFESSDPGGSLGRASRNMVKVALFRAANMRLVRPRAVAAAAKALNTGAAPLRGLPALNVARHAGAEITIRGSLAAGSAGGFRLRLQAVEVAGAAVLAEAERAATGQRGLAAAVESACGALHAALVGSDLANMQSLGARVEPADTLRPGALELFTAGLEVYQYGELKAAVSYFERAAQEDPEFALARVYLALVHGAVRRDDLAFPPILRAYELRDRVNHRQRAHTEALYHYFRGDLQTAVGHYRALLAEYPYEAHLHRHLAQLCAVLDRTGDALRHGRIALDLDRSGAINYMILASALAQAGNIREAYQVLEDGRRRAPESPLLASSEGVVKMIEGDGAAALAVLLGLEQRPDMAAHARSHMVRCLLVYGRLHEARTRLETDTLLNGVTGDGGHEDLARYWLGQVLVLEDAHLDGAAQARLLALRPAEPYSLFALRCAAEVSFEARAAGLLAEAVDKIALVQSRYPSARSTAILRGAQGLQAWAAGQRTDARRLLGEAHGLSPDIAAAWALARICSEQGAFADALPLFLSVIARRGAAIRFDQQIALVRSYAEAGRCCRALGRAREAMDNYGRFLDHWGAQSDLRLVREIRAERDALSPSA